MDKKLNGFKAVLENNDQAESFIDLETLFNTVISNHEKLSAILYLNPDWSQKHGGQLEIYDEKDQNTSRIKINHKKEKVYKNYHPTKIKRKKIPISI